MNRNRQENDPERSHNSRTERSTGMSGSWDDDVQNREETSDLGRAQADGNLGNERTRDRQDDGSSNDVGNMRENRNR